jgi:hypothetical protein
VLRLLAVFTAYLVFMWTFFTTEAFVHAVEALVDTRAITAARGDGARYYGYAWRHGMEGRWPVFMPGFFLLSLALVWWCRWQRPLRLAGEAGMLLGAASVCAAIGMYPGATLLADGFARNTGVELGALAVYRPWGRMATGMMTAGAWTLFIVLLVRGIERRELRLVLLAALPYVALYSRWQDAEVLVNEWSTRLIDGDMLAIVSSLLIPIVTAIVVWRVRRRRRDAVSRSDAATDTDAVSDSAGQAR